MKIIVAGIGKVGETLVEQLTQDGHDITVMDTDTAVLQSVTGRYDVMGVAGNCASMDNLVSAGVKTADLLIAATVTDEVNLLACLTAHGLNHNLHTIARIRNPEYTEQVYRMRDDFALSYMFNPERQSAVEIERLLKYPGFFKRDSFARGRVEIVELRVDGESELAGASLSTLYGIVKCRVLVCAVLRGGEVVIPSGRFVLEAGDRIFVTAPTDNLSLLLKNLGIVTHKVKRVMIVGGGTISYYLAGILSGGHIRAEIVERDPERCAKLAAVLPDTDIICGDANDQKLLEDEGISSVDALITLTGMDEQNILLSLYGKEYGIPQIITKIARGDDGRIVNTLPVGSVISPRKLCCHGVMRYIRALCNQSGTAQTVHAIADGNAEALEFRVTPDTQNIGKPLKEIKFKKNVLLVCISRGSHTEIPNGDSSYAQGDSVVIVSGRDTPILSLNDVFA